MKRSRLSLQKRLVALILLAVLLPVASAQSSAQGDKKQQLIRARDAYYNLRRMGLVEFRANLQPNWDLLLEGVEQKAGAIELLSGLHFSVSISPESTFQVTHRIDQAPTNPKTAEGLSRIVRQMDSALKQFFGTWSLFMLTSPFPGIESEYEVSRTAGQFRFSRKEGESEVVTITDQNFMVTEMTVSAPTYNAWLKPAFEKTENGLVLISFEANSVIQTGPRITSLKTRLVYSDRNGLRLLQKVSVDTVQNGIPAQMEWQFTDYQVKAR